MRLFAAVLLALALPAQAQTVQQHQTTSASAGTIRVLDKISGETTDIEIPRGGTARFGRLQIAMGDCRYPTSDPNSDAYGMLDIQELHEDEGPLHAFTGWMFASSPALSAMDHPRYDVWMLRCSRS